MLAALHFNENIQRERQTSKDGKQYMKVTYPKFKLGDEVVREIAVPPTYGKYDVVFLEFKHILQVTYNPLIPNINMCIILPTILYIFFMGQVERICFSIDACYVVIISFVLMI